MGRKATGSVYQSGGRWYARIRLAGRRESFELPTCTTERAAVSRKDKLVELAAKLQPFPHVSLDVVRGLLERAASRDGQALQDVIAAADVICRGEAKAEKKAAARSGPTIEELGKRWTSGELAREFPDHVREKRSADDDVCRLERYIYPVVGQVAVTAFNLDHAQAVMRGIPEGRAAATRRHVAQLMHRLLGIAVFPLRLIPANPLPKGFLPKVGPAKAKGWLYPDEDAQLLASAAVPLCWRVFYGFLHREGPRLSEAARLAVSDVDLDHGVLALDENKTDDPRAWAISAGVARGLRAWLELRARAGEKIGLDSLVFVDEAGVQIRDAKGLANQYREHLRAAGIDRPTLFEDSKARLKIRLHDTRGTFVTLSLANGKTETWVQDRTGHASTLMINRYRRQARTAAELGLGELAPLDAAIPELAGRNQTTNEANRVTSDEMEMMRTAVSTQPKTSGSRRMVTDDYAASAFKIRGPQGRAGSSPAGATTPESLDFQTREQPATSSGAGQNAGHSPLPPRAMLLAQLSEAVRAAAASGDIEAARVAHEAIGRLLGATVPPMSPHGDKPLDTDDRGHVAPSEAAPVVDLASARGRRGR